MINAKKIVVVDDDPAILEVTKLILEEDNYEVITSLNGSVFNKINGFMPDLILMDVLLSGEDGREIARGLKKQDKTKNIPIIMISAHPSAKESASKFGVDDFIEKPFDIDYLLSTIKKHLN